MDFTELLGVVGRIHEAIEGADAVKATMRIRMKDYSSVLQALQGSAPGAFKHELERLQGLFTEIEDLHAKHTADPQDGRPAKMFKRINRGTQHKSIGEALDAIDGDVVRQFTAIAAKSSINADGIKAVLASLRPPSLPGMAAIPVGAPPLPRSYVERPGVQEAVDNLLTPEKAVAPYTIVGMGGGGKTVLASAVVRNASVRERFRRGVFWIRVGRGANNSLLSLLQGLAREIGAAPNDSPHRVPHAFGSLEQAQQHLSMVVSTGSSPFLVVLDDVWEREVVDALLPLGLKVLCTTRDRSVVGVPGELLELGGMTEDEALELLRKASMTVGEPGDAARAQMTKVVARCGRLPLALAIAGSMPVVKRKGLMAGAWEELIRLFENVAKMMRARGDQSSSIDMVLEASFDALSERKQEEILKMAVLAAGAIAPIEMLVNLWEIKDAEGAREEAEELVSKSLLQDASGGGYRVHDLVLEKMKIKIKADVEVVGKAAALQAQYLGRLDVVTSYRDAKHGAGNRGWFVLDALWRSVETLSGDDGLEISSYLASLGELGSYKADADVAKCYSWVASFFELQGKYTEAEPLYERCQAIQEKVLGPEHPDYAATLHGRAWLLESQGKYAEAEPLYERCQAIEEKALGPEHPNLATTLYSRAGLLQSQGKYAEAEALYERCQAIEEKVLGPEHPAYATTLRSRAGLLPSQGKYAEAEALYERCQAIEEKVLGPEHPDLATTLHDRAWLLQSQGKYAEAEPLYERCQAIQEKVLGPEHPNLATTLHGRAGLLQSQGKYAEAEALYERCQAIREKVLGPEHPDLATTLHGRAGLLQSQTPTLKTRLLCYAMHWIQGKYAEAEALYVRCQAIREKVLGPEHPAYATTLYSRAGLLQSQGKYAEAETLYERCQAIQEKVLGPEHPNLATTLHGRAGLLDSQGKYAEAEPLYERCQAIDEKVLGPEHPAYATILYSRAVLLQSQGKYAEAEALYERCQAIEEKVLGPEHPDLATTLHGRAGLLRSQGKYAEAEALYERCQAIREKVLGPDHPAYATTLHNRAVLLQSQGKHAEAEPLYERCQAIQEKVLGPEHPDLATTLHNRAGLLESQAQGRSSTSGEGILHP
eukprot:g8218.t1